MSRPELHYELRPARGRATGALVLLHGRGADERDLLPLLDELDPGQKLTGVTLRAPLELPPAGYHWYVVREIGHPDERTFLQTYRLVGRWLDSLPAITGVPLADTVLGGFSQGAVMSYALGLGRGRPSPAGLIALSGFIPRVNGFRLDLDRGGLRVAIGHGKQDAIIPVEFGRSAERVLTAAGFEVLYRESPLFHAVDPSFVGELSHWISVVLERRRAA